MNSNVKTQNRTLLAYAAAMWLVCALVATNASANDVRSETVKFADLSLSTSAGVQALYSRIHAAARRVCEQVNDSMADISSCVAKSEGEAIGKVNVPLLTAYYQGRTGAKSPTIIASR
jgi:UrcA family protein